MAIPDPSTNCTFSPDQLGTLLKNLAPPPVSEEYPEEAGVGWLTAQILPPGVSLEQLIYPYLVYDIIERYFWKQGTLQLPVAPPSDGDVTGPLSTPILKPLGGDDSDQLDQRTLQTPPSGMFPLPPPRYGDAPPQPTPGGGSGSGTLQNGITDRTPSVIIPVTAPYGKRIVRFVAARLGAQPDLPDPTPPTDNEALDQVVMTFQAPVWLGDGQTPIWIAAGYYIYNVLQPYWASDGLLAPSTPADNTTLQTNWYDPSQYDGELS